MNLDNAKKNLSSSNPDIVVKSLALIGTFGRLPELQAVLPFTKHANSQVKIAAVTAASDLIRGNLIAHFHELGPQVRQKLGTIMETLDPPVIDDIVKDLYCEDNDRRVRAIQILGLLKKNPKIRELLAKLVQDRNEKIRATAVNLLGRIVGPEDQELVLSLLNDKDKRVRANTVEALEAVGNKKIVPILIRFRKDPNNRIRGNVLKALYTLGFTDIEDDLVAMLQNADNFMRASGLWVVTKIKIKSPKLEDLAGFYILSDNQMVYNNALNALKSLDTPRSKGYLRYLDRAVPAQPRQSPAA
jgi:HEAT repeat protein